ncbi:MAG: 16S rRNA (cytosine(1402)-N(4))-methyltransferase RsmH [Alphaproteobacteria bacterium]|nr:MAG: 16S rRNA (cytosine(1402)-N(4))-methyltransferase RsmH [Alphaproteobacteria bacterium]
MTAPHVPVLLKEVLDVLAPADGEVFVDGTFGAGGYSRAILEAANCTVWAIDRDPAVAPLADRLHRAFPGRFHFLSGCYGEMEALLAAAGVERVDGIVLDIGVSSMQLDTAERGFSFQAEGPLDMRMGSEGPMAADVVNTATAEDLADILYKYGEERQSRRIARAIVAVRADRPFSRTGELARVVEKAVGRKPGKAVHPATRTFQALRIYINDELGELERGLAAAERLLRPGGRLCVVSFHSLEDRIVKTFLRERSGDAEGVSRHLPAVASARAPSFRQVGRKAIRPGADEIAVNPRARSARLRAAVRTDAPAWGIGGAA